MVLIPNNFPIPVIILCGGRGLRYSEVTSDTPKPLIDIGGISLVEFVMNPFVKFGSPIVLATGYLHDKFVDFFWRRFSFNRDVTISSDSTGTITTRSPYRYSVPSIRMINTGETTETGGRILGVIKEFITENSGNVWPYIFVTYGDGISDINLQDLVDHHRKSNKLVTITLVKVEDNYGVVRESDGLVTDFIEKPTRDSYINGGYMVMSPDIIKYLTPKCNFEKDVLPTLARDGQVAGYVHQGYWAKVDTAKDKESLERDIEQGRYRLGA